MPTKYEGHDPVEQERATAYYSAPKEEAFKQKVNSLDDYLNLKHDEKTYVKTEMHISKELEKKNIIEAYGKLSFSYSTDTKNQAYEVFGVCCEPSGKYTEGLLSCDLLAKTGLMIQEPGDGAPVLLKDTLNKLSNFLLFSSTLLKSNIGLIVGFVSISSFISSDTLSIAPDRPFNDLSPNNLVDSTVSLEYLLIPLTNPSTKYLPDL